MFFPKLMLTLRLHLGFFIAPPILWNMVYLSIRPMETITHNIKSVETITHNTQCP